MKSAGFLDFYIAALITGSILGMNRKLLMKAAARYFPAIFGAIALSFGLAAAAEAYSAHPIANALRDYCKEHHISVSELKEKASGLISRL